ncbi:MAG: ATP synthase F1 subunit delta [Planctomycetes bacterium]|nr:ATP synthase F1 subunit delta [Planctomycetota bacterium]
MLIDIVAKRYAVAVFNMARAKSLIKEIKDELEYLGESYNAVGKLKLVLNNPLINAKNKYELLNKITNGSLSPLCGKFMELLIRKRRMEYLPDIITTYKFLLDQYNGVVRVNVRSFAALTSSEEEKIKKRLGWINAGEIILETSIDKTTLGGIILQIDDMVIDGSVKSRLHDLKTHMLSRIEQGKLSNIDVL